MSGGSLAASELRRSRTPTVEARSSCVKAAVCRHALGLRRPNYSRGTYSRPQESWSRRVPAPVGRSEKTVCRNRASRAIRPAKRAPPCERKLRPRFLVLRAAEQLSKAASSPESRRPDGARRRRNSASRAPAHSPRFDQYRTHRSRRSQLPAPAASTRSPSAAMSGRAPAPRR